MKNALVIGIDGMDFGLFRKWEHMLPNLRRVANRGFCTGLRSVYPPDSISAWTTIFTGLNPAEHGLLYTINYLEKTRELRINTDSFKEKSFWDIAGAHGKRVCVLNPFMAYPAWKVNGIMVSGPVFIDGQVSTYPEVLADTTPLPEMGGITDFPTRNDLGAFLQRTRKATCELADLGYDLYRRESWDLFFITFLTLDRVKHFLWRYQDPQDPTYPGSNALINSIFDFYVLFDAIIGRFFDTMNDGSVLIVLSDHGHQRRCYNILYMNELLRRLGYLVPNTPRNPGISPYYWIEKTKAASLEFIARHDLEDIFSRVVKWIPYRSELKKSEYATNFAESVAFTDTDFSGKNPSVGIRLNRQMIESSGRNYDHVRSDIIQNLTSVLGLARPTPIIRWIRRREDVYSGKFIDRYPDILMQLDDDYGIDFTLFGDVFGTSPTHKKISGGHRELGVLLASSPELCVDHGIPGLTDISPMILSLLDIHPSNGSSLNTMRRDHAHTSG